jgi:hypothetical protein
VALYFGRKQTESRDGDEITEAGGEVNSEVTSLSAGGYGCGCG